MHKTGQEQGYVHPCRIGLKDLYSAYKEWEIYAYISIYTTFFFSADSIYTVYLKL